MRVSILYFAGLRASAGTEREHIETTCADLVALYEELRARHGWGFDATVLRVAVNSALVSWSHVLQDGDEIAFLPPFSGG